MLKNWLLVLFVFTGVMVSSSQSAFAQLLEDRNKLKTVKVARSFLPLSRKQKVKEPSGKHKTVAAKKPKYSKSTTNVGSSRGVNPKFSVFTAGQVRGRKINPRYTKMNAGDVREKKINPRYTKTNAGEVRGRKINPRYSQWKQAGKIVVVNPRFSTPPTYSKTKPPGNRKKGFLPAINLYRKPPKHKPGPNSEYAGAMKEKVQKPFAAGEHNQNIKSYKKFTRGKLLFSPSAKMANYEAKTKKRRKGKDAYPSANHISAKYYKSRTVREAKRKFNVIWVRMHGNKIQPDAVKKKPKKSKFDKDEIEIWNN